MSTSLFDLTGKVALVTGSTSGLGQAIAGGLAPRGGNDCRQRTQRSNGSNEASRAIRRDAG